VARPYPPTSPCPRRPTTPALWQITIVTSPEAEEAVGSLLGDLTRQPTSSYHDTRHNRVRVSVFLPRTKPPPETLLARIRAAVRNLRHCNLNPAPSRLTTRPLPPQDWAESWKRHFPAIVIGRKFLLKPTWNPRLPRPGQVVIELDPGLSFGTGHHPTTRFCLESILRCQHPTQPQSLLDLGTGSGLLAIAAAKLQYHPITALEIDPVALAVARHNAQQNRVLKQIRFARADLNQPTLELPAHDVLCANLQADLLIRQYTRIASLVRPKGDLILAGILSTEFQSVRDTYTRLGWRSSRLDCTREWTSAHFRRRPSP
jgi:ribosomal protein L11 methyltransferase